MADKDTPKKMGRPRAFDSPEALLDAFADYVKHTKDNPYLVHDFVGKDGVEIYRKKEKPLSLDGFKAFLFASSNYRFYDLERYFNGEHKDFAEVSARIRELIREEQVAGGMAGIYNASLTARLNGLVDKVETKQVVEQPLFGEPKKEE